MNSDRTDEINKLIVDCLELVSKLVKLYIDCSDSSSERVNTFPCNCIICVCYRHQHDGERTEDTFCHTATEVLSSCTAAKYSGNVGFI